MPSHSNNNIGALGNLTQEAFGDLSRGFDRTNPAFSLGPLDITRGQAINTVLGFTPFGVPAQVMNAYTSYQAEKAAQQALGQNRGFIDTAKGIAGLGNNALDTARSIADTNKDGKVSTREAQNFGMSRGLTAYDVDLNPMSGYQANTVSIQGLTPFGKTDPDAGLGGINTTGQVADVMTQQQVDDMFSGIDTTSGVTGLGGGKGASYSGVSNFSPTEGVDTSDPESTGSTGIGVSNVDSMGNTATTGGVSFSDDAQSSGTGGGDGTYICTALYQMGDMKQYIYEYDQRYGKIVHPAVYRGYELWGKFLAKQIRKKGLIYKITKPLALAWAYQMAYDLSKGKKGKNSKPVKILKTIGEGVCYVLGQIFKRRFKWQKST